MLRKLAILLVEDNPVDADLIKEILSGYPAIKFNIRQAATLKESFKKLEEDRYDLALLDLGLPDSSGLDTLKKFISRAPKLPVIVTTGSDDEETGIQAVKMGAQESLIKGQVDEGRLIIKLIIHAIERNKLMRVIREQAQNMHLTLDSAGDAVISTDARGFIVRLNQEAATLSGWSEAEAMGKSLDNVFKIINEETGQTIPDPAQKVLQTRQPAKLTNHTILLTKKGKKVAVAFSVAPIISDSGVITGTVLILRDQTEEREYRKKIVESKRQYLSLFNSIRDALVVTNTDREIIDCNPAFIELFGYSRDEIIGKKAITIYENENEYLKLGEKLKKEINKADFLYEVNYRKKDGTIFSGEVNVYFLEDDYDLVIGFIGLIRDITPRKEAAEKLQQSERQYRLLADNTLDIIWTMNMDLDFTYVNPAVFKVTGYKPEEWINTNLSDHNSQLEIERLTAILQAELVKGRRHKGVIFDINLKHKDGYDIILEVHGKIITDEKGQPLKLQGTAHDITRRRRTEQKLEKTYAELLLRDQALNSADNAVLITDIDGTIEWTNEAFTTLTGYSEQEALGKNPRDLVKSGKHSKEFYKNLWDTILSGKVWRGEFINKRKDGSLYHEEETITPVTDSHGRIKHFIAIKTDISDRKKLEEQLRQSQKMEAVGQLAGGIAHDFNNLLTVINGYADMLLVAKSDGDVEINELTQIRQAGQRAASLTRQLLAFSRRQILEPEILSLNTVINNTEKMLRRLIGENIFLETSLDADISNCEADPGQMEQVIMNLCINARDAMPAGGRLLIETSNIVLDKEYLKSHQGVKPGNYVMMSFTDNGTGMEKEVRERIFEPFFTTKEEGKGTGLGLSTVYGIVKQSGGNIWVYSEPGQGTTFKIYLPAAGEQKRSAKSKQEDLVRLHGTETILVVEDDDNVRRVVERSLSKYGYNVLLAADGVEAVDAARKHHNNIDLLLTDVVMPKMSGKELADKIIVLYPEIKICFMSGYTDGAIVKNGILDSGINFIQKPFSPKLLVQKLRKILDDNE